MVRQYRRVRNIQCVTVLETACREQRRIFTPCEIEGGTLHPVHFGHGPCVLYLHRCEVYHRTCRIGAEQVQRVALVEDSGVSAGNCAPHSGRVHRDRVASDYASQTSHNALFVLFGFAGILDLRAV